MITVIICIVLGLAFGILLLRDTMFGWFDLEGVFFFALLTVMFGAVGGTVGMGLAAGIGEFAPSEYVETSCVELVALADTSEMHGRVAGSLFLVAGSVDQEMHYAYYYRTGPAAYRYFSVHNRRATIFEDGGDTPRSCTFEKRSPVAWSRWAIIGGDWYEEIHIPAGSILQNFRLDLQ